MGLPADLRSKAVKPLQRKAPPTPHEVITGSDEGPRLNEAQIAGIDAIGNAAGIAFRRKVAQAERERQARADAKQAQEDAIWQDYLERNGRA